MGYKSSLGKRARSHFGSAVRHVKRNIGSIRAGIALARAAHRRYSRTKTKSVRKNADHVGVFTKCWNKKMRRPNRKLIRARRKFAKRVHRVINTELNKNVVVSDMTLNWLQADNGLAEADANNMARVSWLQVGMDLLSSTPTFGCVAATSCKAISASNPGGLVNCAIYGGVVDVGTQITATGGIIQRLGDTPVGTNEQAITTANLDGHRFEIGPRRMHLTLRNPNSVGYWLDMFYVRGRRKTSMNEGIDTAFTATGVNKSQYRSGASATFSYGVTPLETIAAGNQKVVADTTIGAAWHMLNIHASPQDSPMFRSAWKVTKKCRVYLPPGGTLEKCLAKKNIRVLSGTYIRSFATDSSTEFLLCKAVSEVTAGGAGNLIPGHPTRDAAVVNAPQAIIGEVAWRYTYRQIRDVAQVDKYAVQYIPPVIKTIAANQAEPTQGKL